MAECALYLPVFVYPASLHPFKRPPKHQVPSRPVTSYESFEPTLRHSRETLAVPDTAFGLQRSIAIAAPVIAEQIDLI